jgi:hypothetical protein
MAAKFAVAEETKVSCYRGAVRKNWAGYDVSGVLGEINNESVIL